MELEKATADRLNDLRELYDLDTQNGIATVSLHFETAADIADSVRSKPGKPVIKEALVDYLLGLTKTIPAEFKIKLDFSVDNILNYERDSLFSAIKAVIGNRYYSLDGSRRSAGITAAFYAIAGVIVSAVNAAASRLHHFGAEGSISDGAITAIFAAVALILLWKAGSMLFAGNEKLDRYFKSIKRLCCLNFCGTGGDIVCSADQNEISGNLPKSYRSEYFAQNFTLAVAVLVISAACIDIVQTVPFFLQISLLSVFIKLVTWVFEIAASISCLSFFAQKGKFKKYTLLLSLISAFITLVDLICLYLAQLNSALYVLLDYVVVLLFIVNVVCIKGKKHSNNK